MNTFASYDMEHCLVCSLTFIQLSLVQMEVLALGMRFLLTVDGQTRRRPFTP